MKILIIGDSWGAGHNSDNGKDDGWDGFPCVNLAVDGSTAAQWAADFDGRLSKVVAEEDDADATIVSLGGNDAFLALSNDGNVSPEEVSALYSNIQTVVSRLCGSVIIMLYAPPESSDWRVGIGCTLLNSSIRAALATMKVEFADVSKWITPQQCGGGMPPHPTTEGWKLIREKMNELLGGGK